jgi:hypothetical protein
MAKENKEKGKKKVVRVLAIGGGRIAPKGHENSSVTSKVKKNKNKIIIYI